MDDTPPPTHPIPLDGPAPIEAAPALAGDTLALGVVLLLASTVLQRGVGFVREICFCRWLSAEQLGQWDMAFSFLMMAGPILVLSLPGTFGRYAERYRQAGQLRSFLRRTAAFCALLAVPLLATVYYFRTGVAYLVFGGREHAGTIALLVAALVAIIAFNYLTCLFTGLRNMKVVSLVELANSVFFGVFGIALLASGQTSAEAMVVAYAASSVLCVVGALAWLARTWRDIPQTPAAMPRRELWSRLLPLAGWTMVINFLWNLFDVVDRYMIVHLLPSWEGLAEVGNYRSSRVLPLLLYSITGMIAGALLPHLSRDWESGRRREVSQRLNMFLKIWSLLLTFGAAVVLLGAPLLFRVGFQSKFSGGLHVLPWTLTYCTWLGLSMILQTYLWCAEKAYAASIVAFAGVLVNVGLNLVWLPRMGLEGAVLATAAANAVALFSMLALCRRYGLAIQRGTIVALLLPLSIPLGTWVVFIVLAAAVAQCLMSDSFLTSEEKEEVWVGMAAQAKRFSFWPRRAEPAPS